MYAELEVYAPPCHSSLVGHQTHLRITDDCTRPVAVSPIHRDESPTVRCSGQVREKCSKEVIIKTHPSGMGALRPGIRRVG